MREASKAEPHLMFGLDSRRSFINRTDAKIWGARIGVDFDNRWRVGVGGYILGDGVRGTVHLDTASVTGKLRFGYVAWFYEYVFFRKKRFEFSIPGYLGAGTARLEAADSISRKAVGVSEVAVQGHFKVFRWVGVGAGVGYRFLFIPNKQIEENLNSFIYSFKVRIWLAPIYRRLFKGEKDWKEDEWRTRINRGYNEGMSGLPIRSQNTHNYRYRSHVPLQNTILQVYPPTREIATWQYFQKKAF